MKKFYEKQEVWFAVILIAIYSIGQSYAIKLNKMIGIDYSANAILNIIISVFLIAFIYKNKLGEKYKLKKPEYPTVRFLFYIPLLAIVSQNLWNGFAINFKSLDMTCYIVYMLCVGIVEELLFRGMLFEAMAKDNLKIAVVISSVTFGLGHIINLINGVSTDIVETLCQVIGAVAIGFLFVIIYYRGGSILPCIITHSGIDIASTFANETGMTSEMRIVLCTIRFAIAIVYALVLLKTLPKKQNDKQAEITANE